MPDQHSRLGPSSAKRWLTCPGSLAYDHTSRSSVYAAEGTLAHRLAVMCWLLGINASTLQGQIMSEEGFSFLVNDEMVEAIDLYLSVIESVGKGSGYVETQIEHSSIPGFGGTVDYFYEDSTAVHVVDFKFGAGVPVEVSENEQLSCYGLLAIDKFKGGVLQDVHLTVVQPRAEHQDGPVRSWVASAGYLQNLKERVSEVANGLRNEICAGDHCRWCPAKAVCPELYQLTVSVAKGEFEEPRMTPDLASKVLAKSDAIRAYIEAVEQWAHGQLDKGVSIPGYKLVNTYAHRRFRDDEATVIRKLRNKGFGKKQTHKSVMLSPAQLEKVVGKDILAPLVERPFKGTTVVPESDRREAVKRLTAVDEFQEPQEKLGDLF